MTIQPIRVLVVDDSAVVRGLIARALETDPDIVVSGTAMHGDAALSWMRKNVVDVVILDVEMPVMDGLTALKHIQVEFPDVRVVMASSLTREGSATTVRALALGAVDCIAKPVARSTAESIEQLLRQLVPLVKALGRRSGRGLEKHPVHHRTQDRTEGRHHWRGGRAGRGDSRGLDPHRTRPPGGARWMRQGHGERPVDRRGR